MTLPDINPTRKERFNAAIRLASLSQEEWADLHDVSSEHVRLVLKGDRVGSAVLNAAIDATIEKYLGASPAVAQS